MPLEELPLPIKGINEAMPLDKAMGGISPYISNVRPFDVLERRVRMSQRPGMDKVYSEQIGGAFGPIVFLGIVTTVD